ncbi:hypothetical protein AABB24_034790 [Solanum stoloniferum]|uniref:adenine phosphoribosyltransferase n=1 Tax=Solanum stoloniferum TaxID=62892 RepID=A0ABD2RH43_9SOLN
MSACKDQDPRIYAIQSRIRVVPNFPKPGIMFQDITTLLLDPKAFKDAIDLFVERYKDKSISVVAGKHSAFLAAGFQQPEKWDYKNRKKNKKPHPFKKIYYMHFLWPPYNSRTCNACIDICIYVVFCKVYFFIS